MPAGSPGWGLEALQVGGRGVATRSGAQGSEEPRARSATDSWGSRTSLSISQVRDHWAGARPESGGVSGGLAGSQGTGPPFIAGWQRGFAGGCGGHG